MPTWKYLLIEIKRLSQENRAQQTILLIVINLIVTLFLLSLYYTTNSIGEFYVEIFSLL